jgi:hypothetical protein
MIVFTTPLHYLGRILQPVEQSEITEQLQKDRKVILTMNINSLNAIVKRQLAAIILMAAGWTIKGKPSITSSTLDKRPASL